jgi:ribosomal protein S12 methylthiotransferase accessory factor
MPSSNSAQPRHVRVSFLGRGELSRQLPARLSALIPGLSVDDPADWADRGATEDGLAIIASRLDEIVELVPALQQSSSYLYVGLWRGFIYVGPFGGQGRRGCPNCLVTRVANSQFGPDVDRQGQVRRASFGPAAGSYLGVATLALASQLVASEIAAHVAGSEPRTRRGVLVLNARTNAIGFETLLPSSRCVVCKGPTSSTLPRLATSTIEKVSELALRTVSPDSIAEQLDDHYLHAHLGLIKKVQQDLQSPYGTCTLEVALGTSSMEPTIGRSTSYDRSKTVSILEALERYAGWLGGLGRAAVRAPYSAIAEEALDPRTMGLHPEECYELPHYPFKPFDPELPIDWVHGYSFRLRRPVLVPQSAVFYGNRPADQPVFFYETSNGCALGKSMEEAIIHGLLELVERDSYLMTWYRKLALPELSLADVSDPEVRALLRKAELFTHCRFRLFLSTMEHGIPSVWLTALSNDPDRPQVLASAGAHADLAQALKSALFELTGVVLRTRHVYAGSREKALAMLDEPRRVRQMEDHALFNSLPEARPRFAFLLDRGGESVPFMNAYKPILARSNDLRHDLMSLVNRILEAGLDLIAVDQTMDELRSCGLVCARVIVPGLLPMTFGHDYRRVDLPRLRPTTTAVPYPSGVASQWEIGALPHPFP